MTNKGFIDSASVAEVAAAFTYAKFEEWSNWTLQSAVEVTSSLCADRSLQVAPGPSNYSGARGLYQNIMIPLEKGGIVGNSNISPRIHAQAQKKNSYLGQGEPYFARRYL